MSQKSGATETKEELNIFPIRRSYWIKIEEQKNNE